MKIIAVLILLYLAWSVGGHWYYAVIGFFLGCTCHALHYGLECARLKREEEKKLENAKNEKLLGS